MTAFYFSHTDLALFITGVERTLYTNVGRTARDFLATRRRTGSNVADETARIVSDSLPSVITNQIIIETQMISRRVEYPTDFYSSLASIVIRMRFSFGVHLRSRAKTLLKRGS